MRTRLILCTLGAVALVTTSLIDAWGGVSPQVPLAGSSIPQFVDRLPDLDLIPAGSDRIELRMKEFKTMVLPAKTVPGYSGTWVWGYLKPDQAAGQLADGTVPGRHSFIGPVIAATRGVPTEMKFINDLPTARSTRVLAYRYGTDQTLHWADPLHDGESMCAHMAMPPEPGSDCAANYGESYDAPIPAAVHLHGGEVPPQLDGGPDSWFTSDGTRKGASFYSKDGSSASNYAIYRYPNSQEGAPIWFHDHTLGATRLNVYAGLAGAYLVTDPPHDPKNLPELIPLVVQDRMFDSNGQLFFTAGTAGGALWALNPEHPYWNPEFVGDVIVVNGKSWPYKEVQAKRYTLLFLNGSNARSYEMALVDPVSKNPGPPLWVIGTDGGYLDRPVKIDPRASGKLVLLPGERYQVIVDFAGYQAGRIGPNGAPYSGSWLLRNTAKTPYPGGETADGNTTGRILQFRVVGGTIADGSFNPALADARLRGGTDQGPPLVRLADPATGTVAPGVAVHKTRQLTLNEVMGMAQAATNPVDGAQTAYPGGPLEILVNNTKWTGKRIVGVEGGMYQFEPIPGFAADAGGNFVSERPQEGETEVWEIVNLTEDAHPIHLHLAQFQLVNRQGFDAKAYAAAYAAAFPGGGYDPMTGQPYPKGVFIPGFGPPQSYDNNPGNARAVGGNPDIAAVGKNGKPLYLRNALPPLPHEAGWKDTVIAYPGQVTRIAVRWAPTDLPASSPAAAGFFPFDPNGGNGYVWHCHIIDHEDNEMMRPDQVLANPAAARSYLLGSDY